MIRRSTLIAVEILLGLIAALAIGVGVAWWRLSQGPIDLGFIRHQVQSELSAARSGRPVGLERAELAWSPRGALEIRAVGITVEDGRGGVLSRSDEARIELAVLPLLIGRVQLVRADFDGGELSIARKLNGAVHIAFGPEGTPADIIIPPPPIGENLEERVARMLDGLESAFRPVGAGGSLRGLSVHNANLTVVDDGGGGRWTAEDADLELARRGRTLELSANARLEGAQGPAPARFRITTDTQFQSAVVEFGAENVYPRAVFSEAALGPFAGLNAPLTTTISVGLDRQAGVNRFEGEATIGRGQADMAGGRFDLAGGTLRGRYDVETDELIIDQLALNGARTRVGGEIRLRDVSAIFRAAADEQAPFNVSLPALTLDVPGTFEQPIAFRNVQAQGAISGPERSVRFTRLHAETGEAVIDGSGRLYWAEAGEGENRRVRPGIELQANVAGWLDARVVTQVWPMGLGEGARSWLSRSVVRGRVTDTVARLDIRPSDLAAPAFRNEAVDVRFNVADAELRFLSTMSAVTNARGSGVLRGNSFDMNVPEARLNGLLITNGVVEIPQFKPRGALATISGRADGEARRVLELLNQQPLALGDRLPIDAASATGRAIVNVRLQRPMLSEAPFEQWRFTIDGQIRDFAGNMTTRRMAVSQGQLQVRGDQRAITVSGPIRAGTSQIEQVRWTEYLNRQGRASSEYQISGNFDANDLERLGYPVAQYAQGRIGVTVSGEGRGFDVNQAQIELNLTQAAVESPWQFWTKRAGQTASARFVVVRQSDGGLAFNELDARGAGLLAQGRVRLTRDNQIAEVDLTRLAVEGRSDAHVNVLRAQDGGLDVNVRGALFDAAPFMDGESPNEPRAQSASAGAPPPPVRASIIVDRLKMRGDATLSDARVNVTTQRGALAMLTAEGRTPNNGAFSLGLGPRPGEPQGRIRLRSDDAGFAVAALTGADNIVGGTASANGDWRTGPPSQARFNVALRDFQVVRLPAMARLLSSAGSLTGLVETLNGDGIGFNALDAQMVYANNRITFTEGRMAGPSLGLTGSGAYNLDRDDLDVDGVVAPSPVLNLSMLGEIPLIGDLLVSRRGEGVFGMTYSINGPAASPRVGVNPVSALTPGILRRIFEPVAPRDAGGGHSFTPDTPPEGSAPPQAAVEAPAADAPTAPEARPAAETASLP